MSQPGRIRDVQLVTTEYTATVSLQEPGVDEGELDKLGQQLAVQAVNGEIGTDDASLETAVADAIQADPLRFLVPEGPVQSEPASVSGVGTGWVITPDGYMVTAAHVVQSSQEDLRKQFSRNALEEFAGGVAQVVAEGGEDLSPENLAKIGQAAQVYATQNLKVSDVKTEVFAQLGKAEVGGDKSAEGVPVSIVSAGTPFPGKDVAVLKIDGKTNLPTIPLGVDADVNEGDDLYVVGYPYASTFAVGLSKDSELTPTVTVGPLTAKKSSPSGVPVFQTQAPASPGNSGGPVLDDEGEAVGVLVAGALDDAGSAVQGQQFVMPVSVVLEELRSKNIVPAQSLTTSAFDAGVQNFYAERYKAALPDLQRAQALYPGHPYAPALVSQAQTAIDEGRDRTPRSLGWLVYVGVALLVLLLALLGLLVWRRRKRGAATRGDTGPDGALLQPVGAGPAGAAYGSGPPQWQGPPRYGQLSGGGSPGYGPPVHGSPGQPGQEPHGSPGQQPYMSPGQPSYGPPGQPYGSQGQPYGSQGQQPYGPPGQQPYGSQGQQPYGPPVGQPYGPPGEPSYGQSGAPSQGSRDQSGGRDENVFPDRSPRPPASATDEPDSTTTGRPDAGWASPSEPDGSGPR